LKEKVFRKMGTGGDLRLSLKDLRIRGLEKQGGGVK